jgi:predicted nucleic acid-binding protein
MYDTMSARPANRINARLDEALAQKVALVRKRTRRSVSQIVKESLVRFCDEELAMDLADASLVVLAEEIGDGRILSTDKRDFHAYHWKSRKPFRNLLLK